MGPLNSRKLVARWHDANSDDVDSATREGEGAKALGEDLNTASIQQFLADLLRLTGTRQRALDIPGRSAYCTRGPCAFT